MTERQRITNADFVRAVSYMARNCSEWAGDSMIHLGRMDEPMDMPALRRFLEDMRGRLNRIDPDKEPEILF